MDADRRPRAGQLIVPECTRCGYSLLEIPSVDGARCPECGQAVERIPDGGVFVCQPRTWSRRRVELRWTGVGYAAAAGIGTGLGVARASSRLSGVLIGCGVTAVLGPVAWVLLRPRESRRRIIVDLPGRWLRFERCVLQRPWRLGSSTGAGVECRFDELLGSEIDGNGVLLISTPRGRIPVNRDWTCFAALERVVSAAAPCPPAGAYALAYSRRLVRRILLIVMLVLAFLTIATLRGWW